MDWSSTKLATAAKAYSAEEARCVGVQHNFRERAQERRMLLQRLHTIHNQLALKPMDDPTCDGGCSAPNGVCVAHMNGKSKCMCNQRFYGSKCEHQRCPGSAGGFFAAHEAAACHGGLCNSATGQCNCTKLDAYSTSCELKNCPSKTCSGHGQCQNKAKLGVKAGVCKCNQGWAGPKCDQRACPGVQAGQWYGPEHHAACNGKGMCKDGKCACQKPFQGSACELSGCLNDCSGHGKCNAREGVCKCNAGYSGVACESKRCPDNCNGHGVCDVLSGRCLCADGFIGKTCLQATICKPKIADWWTSFDKVGWSLCPMGTFMTSVYRNKCSALSCIEMARCGKPCMGPKKILPFHLWMNDQQCYHASWHDTMDAKGWSRCLPGFFLVGLYRSKCDSLYCLQMGKCCNIGGASWGTCTEVDWSKTFSAKGWSSAPKNHLLTGFYRNSNHTLDGITKASACSYSRSPTN